MSSVLPTEAGEGVATRAESEHGTFPPGTGKNSAFLARAAMNSVLPAGAAVNSAAYSDSEQIEMRIGCGSPPRLAVVLDGPTRITTSLMGTTPAFLSVEIEAVSAQAVDLVEQRVDPLFVAFKPASDRRTAIEGAQEKAVSQAPLPILATTRTTVEGGATELNTSEYAELVALLAGLANAVDVEITRAGVHSLIIRAHETGTVVIAPLHNSNGTPPSDTLATFYAQMAEAGADILKVACRVTIPEGTLRVPAVQVGAYHEHRRPIIGISMGEAGATTRIVGAPFFSAAIFVFVAAPLAPGQFIARETRRGPDLVEKGRAIEKKKSDEGEETVDKARGR